jgi:hypothetical protein
VRLRAIRGGEVTIEVTPAIVAALANVKRCDPVLSGRCPQCGTLQRFWADARALVEPLQSAPTSVDKRAPAAPRARLRKAKYNK